MDNVTILCSPADFIFPRFTLCYVREHFAGNLPVLGKKEKFKNIGSAQFCF